MFQGSEWCSGMRGVVMICPKSKRQRIAFGASLLLTFFGSCSSSSTTGQPEQAATGRSSGRVESCTSLAAAQSITALFNDVSRGAVSDIESHFADGAAFQWYSVTEGNPRKGGRNRAIYSIEDLEKYFRGRYEQREHLELVQLRTERAGSLIHFSMVVRRTADDLADLGISTDTATGKGALQCTSTRIVAMSIGMGAKGNPTICPKNASQVNGYTLCSS